METQQSVRKAFINFTLKEFCELNPKYKQHLEVQKGKKLGKEALKNVLEDNMGHTILQFQKYLLYDVPRLIQQSKRIKKKNDYFEELKALLPIKGEQVNGYFKDIYRNKKQTFQHNSLSIIGRRLQNSTSYMGKKYFNQLIEDKGLNQVITNILELDLSRGQNLERHRHAAIDLLIKAHARDTYNSLISIGGQLAQKYNQQDKAFGYSYFKNLIADKSISQIIIDIGGMDITQKQKDEAIDILSELFGKEQKTK